MNRVLSIETSQTCSGQSVYVTKRLCISFVFAIGFLCILGGYFLGRWATDRRDAALFGKLHNKVDTLLKKAEALSNASVQSNSSEVENKLKNIFECIPLRSDLAMNPDISEFLRTILLHKDNELMNSLVEAVKYLDSIR